LPIEEVTLLPSNAVGSRDEIGVYLEIYGVTESESLDIGLSLAPVSVQPGFLQRIGRALGLWEGLQGPRRLSWKEPVRLLMPGISTWQLSLDTRSLKPGTYQLAIEVRRTSGAIAISSTELRVER
jgi:hypothetical protein